MRPSFRNFNSIRGRATLVVILTVLLLSCGAPGSKEITIVYPSASGLEVGDELRLSDYAIGTVQELVLEQDGTIGVRIKIDSKYREHVTEDATFAVKREALFSTERYIELTPGAGGPAQNEARFVGEPSWEDRLKAMTDQLLDSTGDASFREHLDALAEAAERAAKAGQEEWEARRPGLESEAKRLLEEMEREGSEAAEQLREEIEKYLEDLMEDETETKTDDETRI